MTAEIKGIECPKGQWTPVSTAKARVLVMVRDVGAGRLVLGTAAPPIGAPALDYLTLDQTRPISLQFDGVDTNVYVWPTSETLVVEVVRE
ncbi:hypothetical protein P3T31_002274 [Rhizobium sp. AN70]|nr:hypothetical protein [Rhizobium sp. AN70]